MAHSWADEAVLLARIALAYVYLYAAYLNAKSDNRDWLVTHTALLLPRGASQGLIKAAAFLGVAMMFVGGASVMLGFALWIGAATLIVFTIMGYMQHRAEVSLAIRLADDLVAQADPLLATVANAAKIRQLLLDLRISAYSGQFSSGLKNWGLIGGFVVLGFATGSGRYSVDAWLAGLRPNRLIDLVIWPM
jgi:uncharacterized membrane protein YphA (DoxX/SURF4 family)